MKSRQERKQLNIQQHYRINRVRGKIRGEASRPRLSVKRTLKHCYAQLVDDTQGLTLVAASDLELEMKGTKSEKAFAVGQKLAEKALAKNIKEVVFDRHGYLYHGRVKGIAEGARAGGLKF